MNHEAGYYGTALQYRTKNETLDGRQEVDLGRSVHGPLAGQNVWRERYGQVGVEHLEPLLLSRQAEDLILKALVLLLQRVKGLQDLHD